MLIKDVQKKVSYLLRQEIKKRYIHYEKYLKALFKAIDEDPDQTRLKHYDKQYYGKLLWEESKKGEDWNGFTWKDEVEEIEKLLYIVNNWHKFKQNKILLVPMDGLRGQYYQITLNKNTQ